jgi:hypothetical protein
VQRALPRCWPARSHHHRGGAQHPRLVRRLLSALPAGATPVLTSDSEFYSFTRQIARLEEDGLVAVERIAAEPFASFPQRFCPPRVAAATICLCQPGLLQFGRNQGRSTICRRGW